MIGITLSALLLRVLILNEGILMGFTLSISIFITIIVANLMGAILPIILTKLKFDPAVVSSPLITTIIDTLGLIIYFSIANLVFKL